MVLKAVRCGRRTSARAPSGRRPSGAAATAIGALATLGVIGGSAPDEALAKASTNLRDAGTSALVVKVRLPEPEGGERFAARLLGTGELDYSSGRGQFSYQVEFPNLEESWDIDVTFDGSVLYARLPAEWGLSRDRPWLRADLDELQRLDSEDADVRVALLARLNFEDVSGLLDYLDEAGDVEKVGVGHHPRRPHHALRRHGRRRRRRGVWAKGGHDREAQRMARRPGDAAPAASHTPRRLGGGPGAE